MCNKQTFHFQTVGLRFLVFFVIPFPTTHFTICYISFVFSYACWTFSPAMLQNINRPSILLKAAYSTTQKTAVITKADLVSFKANWILLMLAALRRPKQLWPFLWKNYAMLNLAISHQWLSSWNVVRTISKIRKEMQNFVGTPKQRINEI